jgi:N-acetylmuramoyl-L-alanine amidase
LILILVLAATLLIYGVSPVSAENDGTSNKKVILIDPGHGGYDGGAEGKSGIKEKDVNLSISLKLKENLQKEGYEVKMIREEDKALLDPGKRQGTKKAQDIANRCKIKQESNADLFISIHQNHFPQGKYYGAQVWYSKNKQSHMLGKIVQDNLKKDLNHSNKRVEKPAKDSYKILSCEDSKPSILVECGFLSNPEEEQRILNSDYQQKIVDSITKSVDEFFEKAKQLE